MTQSDAIRGGEAPEKPARQVTQSSAYGSAALSRVKPEVGSPQPQRLEQAISDQLSKTDSRGDEVRSSKGELAQAVAERIASELGAAVELRGRAHVCLTGGSMGAEVVRALAEASAGQPWWDAVHVWWGDERFVPAGHADRNDRQADDAGLTTMGIPDDSIHRLLSARSDAKDVTNDLAGLPAATADYATQLASLAEPIGSEGDIAAPIFDVMLLGMGPDTHVASLFPERGEVLIDDVSITTVSVTDSPKPPPLRVSMTVPVLNNSRSVFFIVAGADKAEAVDIVRSCEADTEDVPASWVRGQRATVWWLDTAAAGDSS